MKPDPATQIDDRGNLIAIAKKAFEEFGFSSPTFVGSEAGVSPQRVEEREILKDSWIGVV
jgi:hypothetical protein